MVRVRDVDQRTGPLRDALPEEERDAMFRYDVVHVSSRRHHPGTLPRDAAPAATGRDVWDHGMRSYVLTACERGWTWIRHVRADPKAAPLGQVSPPDTGFSLIRLRPRSRRNRLEEFSDRTPLNQRESRWARRQRLALSRYPLRECYGTARDIVGTSEVNAPR